jgi:hypothetical protein
MEIILHLHMVLLRYYKYSSPIYALSYSLNMSLFVTSEESDL